MKVLTKVLVGSRLHGLHNENSDYDYRGIHINPLKDVLSPFKKTKNTEWIEGSEDNTSYELADFCNQATKGNATILEVFFSNEIIETTPIVDEMRGNSYRFIDTDRVVAASRGYASNQYTKMQLFDTSNDSKPVQKEKFAIAYCRVLWQCSEFLRTGDFPCQVDEPELKEMLLRIKNNWSDDYIPELTSWFTHLQSRVDDAYQDAQIIKPDYEWIEDFILRAYTGEQ